MTSIYTDTRHGRHLSPLPVVNMGRWHQEPSMMTARDTVNGHQHQNSFQCFIGKYKPTSCEIPNGGPLFHPDCLVQGYPASISTNMKKHWSAGSQTLRRGCCGQHGGHWGHMCSSHTSRMTSRQLTQEKLTAYSVGPG